MSEFDDGWRAGQRSACAEAIRIVQSHIDRLAPGRHNSVRSALVELEASLRSIMLAQRMMGLNREQVAAIWSAAIIEAATIGEPDIMTFARRLGVMT